MDTKTCLRSHGQRGVPPQDWRIRPDGFEPSTPRVQGGHSNQTELRPVEEKAVGYPDTARKGAFTDFSLTCSPSLSGWEDSNLRQLRSERSTLAKLSYIL